MIREHIYLGVFLLCMILLSFLVQDRYYQTRQSDNNAALTHIPDQFVNNVDWLSWDLEGQPVNQLQANRLEHFPEKQGTFLFQPRLIIKKTPTEIWLAQSDKAWIPDSQPQISLENNVHVTLQSATSTTFVSEQLTVDTQANQAYTNLPVEIKSKRGVITSVGIHADFETGKILLQDKVRGKHDTSSR